MGRLADEASDWLGWGIQAYRVALIFAIVLYLIHCFKNVIYLLMEWKESLGETLLFLNTLMERVDLIVMLALQLFFVAVGGGVFDSVVYLN